MRLRFPTLLAALAALSLAQGTLRASESVRLASLLPEADALVDQATPAVNFGTNTTLGVNHTAGALRETFLRYDLSAISNVVERAILMPYSSSGASVTNARVSVELVADTDDGWSESGITWTNKPASLSASRVNYFINDIGNNVISGSYSGPALDITALVTNTLAADPARKLSVRVYAYIDGAVTPTGPLVFGSREDNNSSPFRKPQLHLTLRTGTGTVTRIMPLGDSITRAAAGGPGAAFSGGGWRYFLQNRLIGADIPFSFVGPRPIEGSIAGTFQGSDRDRPLWFMNNGGFSGQSIEYLRDRVAGWIATNQPDIITLMIGANNIGYSGSYGTVASASEINGWKTSYRALLDNILTAQPAARVVMARITPLAGTYSNNNTYRVEPFNAQVVQSLYDEYSAAHPGQFALVDNYSTLTASDITGDNVHPNSSGHVKMSRNWLAGIQSLIGRTGETVDVLQGAGADAFINGGIYATNNYGNPATAPAAASTSGSITPTWRRTLLRVRANASADNRTKSYFKFDLAGRTTNAAAARVTFVVHGPGTSGGVLTSTQTFSVYGVPDGSDGWSKTNLTWNNAPSHDTNGNGAAPSAIWLGSIPVPAGTSTGDQLSLQSSELLDFVMQQRGADQLVTLFLVAEGSTSTELMLHHGNNVDYQVPFLTLTPATAPSEPDTIPPVNASGWPKADTATTNGFTVRARLNEPGTARFVVLTNAAPAPSLDQVESGLDATGNPALRSGTLSLSGTNEVSQSITSLAASTGYLIHLVARDTVGNRQSNATALVCSTLGAVSPAAGLFVYEPFAYTVGTAANDPDAGLNSGNGLPAQNTNGTPPGTGTGLYGSYGAEQVIVSGLTYSDSNGTLSVSGGANRVTNATFSSSFPSLYRNMAVDPWKTWRVGGADNSSAPFGVDGQSLFLSVLLKADASWVPGNQARALVVTRSGSTNYNLYFGVNGDGGTNNRIGLQWGANGGGVSATNVATAGTTFLVVLKFTYAAGGSTVSLFVNPPLGTSLPAPSAGPLTLNGSLGNTFSAGLTGVNTRPNAPGVLVLDELRVGMSAAAVLPCVPPAMSPLETWRLAYFGVSSNTGDAANAADPESDGLPNLVEYALGGNPQRSDTTLQPTPGTTAPDPDERLTLTFIPHRDDVNYFVQSSTNLVSWSDTPITAFTLHQSRTFTNTASFSTAPQCFLRLKVAAP